MKTSSQLTRFLAVLLSGALFASATNAYAEPLFEFCDDFAKGACQRDPFEERIETERHDFTQSAVTVGRGIVQIEGGYSYFYTDTEHERESAHAGPELMLRLGLTEDIEVRVRWNHAWVFVHDEHDHVGSEDLRYGLKLQMTRQVGDSFVPTSALELRGTAPTGGEAFSTEQVEFSLDYIYQWLLTEGVTIAGSTGYGTNGFADFGLVAEPPTGDHFNVLSQSAVLGVELSELNTAYAEWYGIYSDGLADEYVFSIFNIGIDHYLSDDFVIDFRAGLGLSDDSEDFFTGIGGGYRF